MEQHPKKPPTPASWKPGQSGNPRGRRGRATSLTDAIRDGVDPNELRDIALELARNGESEGTRIAALNWLAAQGFTKPAERLELARGEPEDDLDAELADLSLDQLRDLQRLEHEHEERRRAIVARPVNLISDGGV